MFLHFSINRKLSDSDIYKNLYVFKMLILHEKLKEYKNTRTFKKYRYCYIIYIKIE